MNREQLRADLAAEYPDFLELPLDAQELVLDDALAVGVTVGAEFSAVMEAGFERIMARLDELVDVVQQASVSGGGDST